MKSPFFLPSSRRLPMTAGALMLAGISPLSAAVFSGSWNSGFTNAGAVPDGNGAGWSDSRAISIPSDQTVTDVNVSVSMSGGWNGDLYAYLTHPNCPGVAVLLNRPGRTASNSFGFSDSILTITLDDGAANGDTHFYQSASGYPAAIGNNSAFQPDGRTASPLTVNGTEPRTNLLSIFNGMDPSSGNWTLFVADLASGDVTTVASWGLSVTTIPEPRYALLALLSVAVALAHRRRCAIRFQ